MAAAAPPPPVCPVAIVCLPEYDGMPGVLRDNRDSETKWHRHVEKLNAKDPALHFVLWLSRLEVACTSEDVWLSHPQPAGF